MSASVVEAASLRAARRATVRARSPRALPLGRLALRGLALALSLAAWHLAATYRLDLGVVTFRNVPTPAAAGVAFRIGVYADMALVEMRDDGVR